MTVSISRMSIAYYLGSVAAGDGTTAAGPGKLTSYYTESGDPPGTWFGNGVSAAGLTAGQEVTKLDAVAVYEKMTHPRTGAPLGKTPMKRTEAPEGAKTPKGKPAAPVRQGVSGFDLTFSVPKSISVLWAMADVPTQTKIHAAHQEAVRTCLKWAEDNIIQSRAGDGGVVKTPVEGLLASLFDHADSRAGDPQLHTHAVISNRVRRASDGAWVTLDSYTLHRWVVAVSEMYNATVYDNLAHSIGAVPDQRDPLHHESRSADGHLNHRVELLGVPDELIEEFSSRSQLINDRAAELVRQWEASHDREAPDNVILDLRRQATLDTRDAKPAEKLPLSARVILWRQQALDRGYLPREVAELATGLSTDFYTAADFTDDALTELGSHALRRAALKHPTFTRANVDAAVHRMLATTRFADHEQRMRLTSLVTDAALDQAVALTPERHALADLTQDGLSIRGHSVFDSPETALYTTAELLDVEKTLMDASDDHRGAHLTDQERTAAVLTGYRSAKGHPLAEDQRQAAADVLGSDATISAIIGPAGTGKTTTLAGIRVAWEDQHGADSVIGLAPSAAAAQVLGEELSVSTDNIAKWLYETVGDGAAHRAELYRTHRDTVTALESELEHGENRATAARLDAARTRLAATIAEQTKYQLRAGQILIVDEASMASTTDLYQLHAQVQQAGAKMLLIGDPRQLEAVEAGGFLGWMENTHRASTLSSVWRFEHKWEAQNSLKLRDGHPSSLATLAENGRVVTAGDALDSAYQAWASDTAAGKASVLIAGRNDAVHELNQRAQADRIAAGHVDTSRSVTIRAGESAHLGDTILARTNNRRLVDENGSFVKNGSRLHITGITPTGVDATREDTGAAIRLPLDYCAASVELGYASTAHRAQGLTVDTAHVAVEESFGREQLYVGLTRGKQANVIHVTPPPEQENSEHPDPWGVMRARVPESVLEKLNSVLANSSQDKTAHEVRDAEHGWAHDLSRYMAEAEYVTTVAATRRLHAWVGEHTGEDPRAIADTPEMKEAVRLARLHDLDPAQVIPDTVTTLPEAVGVLRDVAKDKARAVPEDLMPRATHTTADEQRALETITAAANARVEQVLRVNAGEPWLAEAKAEHPGAEKAIVQWRALSHQDDADTALGFAPRRNEHRLNEIHGRLQQILTRAEEADLQQIAECMDPNWYDKMLAENAAQYFFDAEPLPVATENPEHRRAPETTAGPSPETT